MNELDHLLPIKSAWVVSEVHQILLLWCADFASTRAFFWGQIFTMCVKSNWGKLELFWKSVNSTKLPIFCQTFETTRLRKIKIKKKFPGSHGRRNLCTSSTFYIWKEAPTPTPHSMKTKNLPPAFLQCESYWHLCGYNVNQLHRLLQHYFWHINEIRIQLYKLCGNSHS